MITCRQGGTGGSAGEHGHEHNAAVRKITLFTDSSEFYIEHDELVSGHKAAFLVHLTRLSSYKPYTEGVVTVTLESGEKQTTGSAEQPLQSGIWRVLIRPEQPGDFRILFSYSNDGIDEKAIFREGRVTEHHHGKTGTGEDGHAATEPEGIRFTKEQAWKSDFAVHKMYPEPFSEIIKTGGEILAMPGEKHFVHAHATGIINYRQKNFVAGASVQEGEVLLRIEGQDLAAGNISVIYAEAEARFLKSRSEYERHRVLFVENAISEKDFIVTRAAYLSDSIRYTNLRQTYSGEGLNIVSPVGGYVHSLLVSQGEHVQEGQLVATISSDERLLLRADVPQHYSTRINEVVSTNFRTAYQKAVFDLEDLGGKLIAIGSSVHENNQYLPVYFEVQNNGELLEGAYAEFFLKTGMQENCMTVPLSAVLEESGGHYVFTQASGEHFTKRKILLGESDGKSFRVLQGLETGDRVVTRGGMLIRAASMSNALPSHTHSH